MVRDVVKEISKKSIIIFLAGVYSLMICGCQDTILSSENSIVTSAPVEEWSFEKNSSETSQDI